MLEHIIYSMSFCSLGFFIKYKAEENLIYISQNILNLIIYTEKIEKSKEVETWKK